MKTKLTNDDIGSLKYFHKYKDITSWAGFEENKHLVEQQFPEVIHAMKQLEIAQRTLDKLVDAMEEE